MVDTQIISELKCYHCGQKCVSMVWSGEKAFCCSGCVAVYDLLLENNLCTYYSLDQRPGINRNNVNDISYTWLDDVATSKTLLEFSSASFARITFRIDAIHCVSCIWLLENLQRIRKGIQRSEVNFTAKTLRIEFNPELISLGQLASQLAELGYEPQIETKVDSKNLSDSTLVIKLVIAGFAFGNIMLLSFPEYLGLDDNNHLLKVFFSGLNIALALPVMLYSARDYFLNTWRSIARKQLNIDVPIAAGLLALFLRSVFEIITNYGPGYLDSLTGLVFFLLIGRWFQEKTYQRLSFERDYKSYFPLTVQARKGNDWVYTPIHEVQIGDTIQIRNLEIIAADGTLESSAASVDYSFVTGETTPIRIIQGETIFAGGRSVGIPISIRVTKTTAHSHLTSLWNSPAFQKQNQSRRSIDSAARYFTGVVMVVAVITAAVWYAIDPSRVWLVLTSVLMVACPCALALAFPFTYGTLLRIFGRHGFYLKNAEVIEQLARIDAFVFDKTGTITYTKEPTVIFNGELKIGETALVRSLVRCSAHALSAIIYKSIDGETAHTLSQFREYSGKGIEGFVDGHFIKIGSREYAGGTGTFTDKGTCVFVKIDNNVSGYFSIDVLVRRNLKEMLTRLRAKCLTLISGDDEHELGKMKNVFPEYTQMLFRQSPQQKQAFIDALQKEGKLVMMVGDGLNDAGAIMQSDFGIAVTDDTSLFTPACDGIIHGKNLQLLDKFLDLARVSRSILAIGFGLSFFYNAIALTFAISGHLTPLVAAILMPLSSISVVTFSTSAVTYVAGKKLTKQKL